VCEAPPIPGGAFWCVGGKKGKALFRGVFEMIHCPKCGHENPDNAINCAKCRINLRYAFENAQQLEAQWQAEQQKALADEQLARQLETLLVTTTPTVQGRTVSQYLGVVSSVVVLGTGFGSELSASIADLLGTRASAFQEKLTRARKIVVQEMKEQALQRDGDGIVGLNIDYMTLTSNLLMVSGNGTVVKFSTQEGND
jgi:uncharacterized protein YbjQ (UPF0145 family)/ribosomal protein L40E